MSGRSGINIKDGMASKLTCEVENMRNIDRLRAMSLEELAPYLICKVVVGKEAIWHSPGGYTFTNYDAAIENTIHWLDKEYYKEN